MKEKYILTEEDVRNLPDDQRRDYEDFMNTVRSTGTIYRAKLENLEKVLEGQFKAHVLYNPNGNERYPEIFAKNVSNVLDMVAQYRNDVIQEKKSFNKMGFEEINEGLEVLKKNIQNKLNVSEYRQLHVYGDSNLESLLPRIEQMENQISQDIEHFQEYKDEKWRALEDYKAQKEQYDSLSTFGKLRAKLNGQKQKLDEAQRKNTHYNSQVLRDINPELGEMFNPNQYDEYLEQQKQNEAEEEKSGGMSL